MDNQIPRRVRPYVVFISHSDIKMADQVKIEIEKYAKKLPPRLAPFGVKALIAERKEKPGEDLKEKLGYMIQASSRVVALLTLKATQSEMVKWEMKKAHQEFGVKIMPFVENEGCTLRVGLPKTLEWHQLDKNDLSHIGKHIEEDFKQNIDSVERAINGWRPRTILKDSKGGITVRRLDLRERRKAEDDAWRWLKQQGIISIRKR